MQASYVAVHVEEDRLHWWFRGRLAVLLAVLRRELPPHPVRLLELGCGTGNVLGALQAFGEAVGMEPNAELRAVAQAAGLDVRVGKLPGETGVEPGWADVVLLLDVLEHLDDEHGSLRTAYGALRPGGMLVVTVPAYPWLWSGHDEALGHRRRYTARSLSRALHGAGFAVAGTSYFNALLFPAIALVRTLHRLGGAPGHDLRRPSDAVNRLLERVLALEGHVVPRVRLPFGASVLAIARR
ncbi:MAG: class I SAM-dependent methyltransferase [Candidatus Rokubacteria bacterium]|nr:class I SAM-dependent methyltransferase [Candidatus Rokubacteria bacterium]